MVYRRERHADKIYGQVSRFANCSGRERNAITGLFERPKVSFTSSPVSVSCGGIKNYYDLTLNRSLTSEPPTTTDVRKQELVTFWGRLKDWRTSIFATLSDLRRR
jgi:hypothetical protein